MAYLKSRKGKNNTKTYYQSVINMKDEGGKYIYISLKTNDYKIAMQRHEEIEDKEKAIKKGMTFTWSWEDGNRGRARIVNQTIEMLINEWLEIKKINVRKRTCN